MKYSYTVGVHEFFEGYFQVAGTYNGNKMNIKKNKKNKCTLSYGRSCQKKRRVTTEI